MIRSGLSIPLPALYCQDPFLALHPTASSASTFPYHLPATPTSLVQPPSPDLNPLFPLSLCQIVFSSMLSSLVLFPSLLAWFQPCLSLTRLLACSLSVPSLPGFPPWRSLCKRDRTIPVFRLWIITTLFWTIKLLNYNNAGLILCCSWVQPHAQYTYN